MDFQLTGEVMLVHGSRSRTPASVRPCCSGVARIGEKAGGGAIARALIVQGSEEFPPLIFSRAGADRSHDSITQQSGGIDPTKVTRSALQNAWSIAALMLTTEVMIAEIPEKRAPGPGRSARPRHGLLRRLRAGHGGSAAEVSAFEWNN